MSDSERGNLLPPHGLLFPISSKGSFICTIPDRLTHTTGFVTPVVEHWLEQEIAQWVHPMKDRSDDPSHRERTLFPRSYTISNGRKTMLYLTMHSTHFIYGLKLVSDIGEKNHSASETENVLPQRNGIRFRLAARVLLYAPSHFSFH